MANNLPDPKNNGNYIAGLILIGLGLLFIMQRSFGWASWDRLWPLLIVAIGVIVVLRHTSKPRTPKKVDPPAEIPARDEPLQAEEVEVIDKNRKPDDTKKV